MSVEENICDITVKTNLTPEVSVKNDIEVASVPSAGMNNKIFIGNLSYKTTEADLRTLFSCIGNILSVTIPVRRSYKTGVYRSMGIAFITFSTEDDAQKAIETCDRKSLLDRVITVTYANPPQRRSAGRRQKNQRSKTRKSSKKQNENQDSKETSDSKAKKSNAVTSVNSDANLPSGQKYLDQNASFGGPSEGETKNQTRFGRSMAKRGPKGPPVDGINSKTTVFVAGLSYDTKDEQLIEWFSDYNPLSAHIALRPIPRYMVEKLAARGEHRKGRGFGFVTFENESMQIKAVEEMNDKEICGRRLTVKIAVDKATQNSVAPNDSKDSNDANAVTD